jgi:hypothetical protein
MCSNFATRMQKTQLHDNRSCPLCFFFLPSPRLGYVGFSTDKGFPYAIALSYMCGVQ